MSGFMVTKENPDGHKLEDILMAIRKEIIERATKITDDHRPPATAVLNNDIKIMGLLSECIELAESSSKILEKNYGPHQVDSPRIGVA